MAFTEFYCDASTGDNLNAGTGGTNDYTTAGGNWTQATRVFTVTDSTNPSTKIAVNDFCSVYVTSGATVATFVGRVSAVQNATNGTVTFSTAFMGANPSNGSGTMTLKHGGFWKGPNAGVAFPLDRANVGTAMNTSSDQVRINLKNGTSYSISSGISSSGLTNATVQGYTTTPGDGGKATIDGSTNAINLWTEGSNGSTLADLIFASSATSGTNSNLLIQSGGQKVIRVVSHGSRGWGIVQNGGSNSTYIECEAYDNNKSNTASVGGMGFSDSATTKVLRCYSHDNTGSNTGGFVTPASGLIGIVFVQCIADTNGGNGFNIQNTGSGATGYLFLNCDAYNNTGDGIKFAASPAGGEMVWIENCNFIKNGGKGINNAAATAQYLQGYVYNCGYGSGTQANGGGDATLGSLVESGKIIYASGVTPYNDPSTGDFRINLAAAKNSGRGSFTQTDGTNTGTVGYPDIGSAQHLDSGGTATQKAYTFGG